MTFRLPLLVAFCAAVLLSATLAARATYNLGNRVIHLYVDPVYGEDLDMRAPVPPPSPPWRDCADVNNPGVNLPAGRWPTGCPGPKPLYPTQVVDVNATSAPRPPLLHQAYPYRTITRAVQSIPSLPWPTSGQDGQGNTYNVTWSHAVVHLLPGIYARGIPVVITPTTLGPELYHLANGLRLNREEFPIVLPTRVSIQGTSTLNTIVDLAAGPASTSGFGPAFEFGVNTTAANNVTVPANGIGSFIDSVTIVGAHQPSGDGSQTFSGNSPRVTCGIYIAESLSSRPTISNCVFFRNGFGVYVAASDDEPDPTFLTPPSVTHDGTMLINNTFVWNSVGLQNGQHGPNLATRMIPAPGMGIGWSKLVLVNNVFDTYQAQAGSTALINSGGSGNSSYCNRINANLVALYWPTALLPTLGTAFQGVHADDLYVSTPFAGTPYTNFNAYEYDTVAGAGPFNTPGGFLVGFNWLTSVRPGAPAWGGSATNPLPGVNIAPYTGYQAPISGTRYRGILYIRDLLCNGARSGHAGTNWGFLQESGGATTSNPDFDGSFMDFRLAPVATLAANNTMTPFAPDLASSNSVLNPLVDRGLSTSTWTMANGLAGTIPGILLPSSDPDFQRYAFDNWQWDMEGFGNPRIFDHPRYPNYVSGPDMAHTIDLGADELGELIIPGYRAGTTSFLHDAGDPNYLPANPTGMPQVPPMDNRYAWYIGPRSGTPGVGPLASNDTPAFRAYWWGVDLNATVLKRRPNTSYQWNGYWVPWYSPPTVATGRYRPWRFVSKTAVGTCTIPSTAGTPTWYLPTLADITPHLMPDIHPWWQTLLSPLASNPIWQPCPGSFPTNPYNIFLFVDPNYNRIHPPGTYVGGALPSGLTFNYLDLNRLINPPLQAVLDFPKLGQLPATLIIPSVDGFDIWCLGTKGTPQGPVSRILWPHTKDDNLQPALGASELLGVRFSLEHGTGESGFNGAFWTGENGNLQTFLVFVQKEQE